MLHMHVLVTFVFFQSKLFITEAGQLHQSFDHLFSVPSGLVLSIARLNSGLQRTHTTYEKLVRQLKCVWMCVSQVREGWGGGGGVSE